mmetsp:Transcript_30184/g.80757  ORF Transcript_30184/g.80757 Transcript_30184/m.80757 type:complete len:332 (+) Transcript_30184:156-1151(+)
MRLAEMFLRREHVKLQSHRHFQHEGRHVGKRHLVVLDRIVDDVIDSGPGEEIPEENYICEPDRVCHHGYLALQPMTQLGHQLPLLRIPLDTLSGQEETAQLPPHARRYAALVHHGVDLIEHVVVLLLHLAHVRDDARDLTDDVRPAHPRHQQEQHAHPTLQHARGVHIAVPHRGHGVEREVQGHRVQKPGPAGSFRLLLLRVDVVHPPGRGGVLQPKRGAPGAGHPVPDHQKHEEELHERHLLVRQRQLDLKSPQHARALQRPGQLQQPQQPQGPHDLELCQRGVVGDHADEIVGHDAYKIDEKPRAQVAAHDIAVTALHVHAVASLYWIL